MKKECLIVLVLFVLALAGARPALAQYEEIRFPIPADDVALFNKNKIMGETQWSLENDKKLPYMSKAFDPGGNLVISVDYYHRKYYIYNIDGRMTSCLDSARTDKGFEVSEYKFKYYDNGLVREMTGPNMHSNFLYEPATRELTEKLVRNDSNFTNKYIFDDKLRLVKIIFYNVVNKPYMRIYKNYAPDGRIFNQVSAQMEESFSDSSLTVFEYNDKKQLFKKQQFRFQNFYFSKDGKGAPDHSATHYNEANTSYNLDDKGRPVAEEFTIKGDKLTYRYSTWTYDKNGLLTKETYRIGKAEPRIVVNEYLYY